jgi:hypothetical protein
LKTLPRFSLNRYSKLILGTVLNGLCLSSFAQTTPLATPTTLEYPGIIQTFEKLIQIDNEKIKKRTDILTNAGRLFGGATSVQNLDLEPDFLNSIILHSDPGYLRMASTDKCRFYEGILTDLLRSSEGKIKNVLMTYVEKDTRQSAIISKKDFLAKVVNEECPQTQKTIAGFQIKTIQETLRGINFDIPTGFAQCRNIHLDWVTNPKTPFLCQIHEYMKEARLGGGEPQDLQQRRAVARILDEKLTPVQKDYIENICNHLDDEDLFCEEFLNVSFWTKIAAGYENKNHVEDICRQVMKTESLSDAQYMSCMARLKKESDLCMYPGGVSTGLRPQPNCDQISVALNYSSLKSRIKDCPGSSDQMVATNMARIITHFNPDEPLATEGPCSASSVSVAYRFNKKFDNEENWKLEACYDDRMNDREMCFKTFFGKNGNEPAAFTNVVADILKRTRGADQTTTCEMVDSGTYNPLLLRFKSGCYIIYEKDKCFISQCKHKIVFNDRPIDLVKIKGSVTQPYFPLSVREERFSQNYLLTRDFKKTATNLSNLSTMTTYFKKSRHGLVHGIGCAEELLPTFFKSQTMNQCTALPFIINGLIKDKDKVVFVTRTAADTIEAPRLMSWSSIYSAVKSYQRIHPLKLWTMYGLD